MKTIDVDAMRRAHARLREDLRDLENAIQPSSGSGIIEICDRLGAVRDHVAGHFREKEEGGYMDVVRQRQPRLDRAVEQLAAEHSDLLQSLDAIIRQAGLATAVTERLRKEMTAWLRRLGLHDERENQLIEDAFDLDIGPAD